jgi:hypothetical protein
MIDEVKGFIDKKLVDVTNCESLLRGQVGKPSSYAVNTLTKSFGKECIPWSKYVMDSLFSCFRFITVTIDIIDYYYSGWVRLYFD